MKLSLYINRVSNVRYYSTPIFRVIKNDKKKNQIINLNIKKKYYNKNDNLNRRTIYNYDCKHRNNIKHKSYNSYKNMYSGLPIYNILNSD